MQSKTVEWLSNNCYLNAKIIFLFFSYSLLIFINWPEPLLYHAPFVVSSFSLVMFLTFKDRVFVFPWSFLMFGLFLKSIAWILLGWNWDNVRLNDSFWPLTAQPFYVFELASTFLIIVFAHNIYSHEQRKTFNPGTIADITLIFLSTCVGLSIIFYSNFVNLIQKTTLENLPLRVQGVFATYYLFLAVFLHVNYKIRMGNYKGGFVLLTPFMVHSILEAYIDIVTEDRRLTLTEEYLYSHITVALYWLAGFFLLLNTHLATEKRPEEEKTHYPFRLSPLVWVATGATLLVVPVFILVKNEFDPGIVSTEHQFWFFIITGSALFIRFSILLSYARQQQESLARISHSS